MSDDNFTEQSKIEERLRSALKRLDVTSQFLIQSLFGILGCSGRSCQKVAQREEVSPQTIEGLQADALRALMGYGPKSPTAKRPHKPKSQNPETADYTTSHTTDRAAVDRAAEDRAADGRATDHAMLRELEIPDVLN